jgi:hypothetical protein
MVNDQVLRNRVYDANVKGTSANIKGGAIGPAGLCDLVLRRFGLRLNKTKARQKWSSTLLRTELVQYAALDALASVMPSKNIFDNIQRNLTAPETAHLSTGSVVRLLAQNSKDTVGFGKVNRIENETPFVVAGNNKRQRTSGKKVNVQLEHVCVPASTLDYQNNNTIRTLEQCGVDEIVLWNYKHLRLESQHELSFVLSSAAAAKVAEEEKPPPVKARHIIQYQWNYNSPKRYNTYHCDTRRCSQDKHGPCYSCQSISRRRVKWGHASARLLNTT